MVRSLRGSLQTRKTFRLALSGAAVSLALATLAPGAQAITFVCDDDLGHDNFTCGDHASTSGTFSTAVGDSAVAVSSGTAFGSQANAAGTGGTAVGFLSRAESNGVAVGSGSAVFGSDGTAVGGNALSESNGTAVGSDTLTDANGTAVGASANAGHAGSGAMPARPRSAIARRPVRPDRARPTQRPWGLAR